MPITELAATTALVVVDVQSGTLPNARSVPGDQLLDRVSALLTGFRKAGHTVVHLVTTGTPDGRTQHAETGQSWSEDQIRIPPEAAPSGNESVLRRRAWSGFSGTDLEQRLRAAGITTVVVAGLATTFGVESTARSAYDLGFDVVVAADAVSDPDPTGHERSLTRVFPVLGQVVTADEILNLIT
ncbi:cysteine hydrolase family protein [Nocardia jinanensis]|uniref:Hydrolase n=1 Tax=Nocardia jinanensis TaxID=382504 RepID=A0A917R7M8_9NOCA|nr:cysteine hydrolase [Nocardia jinanensis]GGK93513.1 hydrolase [Nocardia jinanensis]